MFKVTGLCTRLLKTPQHLAMVRVVLDMLMRTIRTAPYNISTLCFFQPAVFIIQARGGGGGVAEPTQHYTTLYTILTLTSTTF